MITEKSTQLKIANWEGLQKVHACAHTHTHTHTHTHLYTYMDACILSFLNQLTAMHFLQEYVVKLS